MFGIYLLPWLVPLLLIATWSHRKRAHVWTLSKRNHTPEMFHTTLSRWGFLRQIQEEKLLFKETMSAQEPL